jgi:hypothetical protein
MRSGSFFFSISNHGNSFYTEPIRLGFAGDLGSAIGGSSIIIEMEGLWLRGKLNMSASNVGE